MVNKSLQAFNWKGRQGEFVQNSVAEGKLPPNPTKYQYKVVYDVSGGMFYNSRISILPGRMFTTIWPYQML